MQNALKKHGFRELLQKELFSILLIIVVTFAGFGLGKLSAETDDSSQISIYYGEHDFSSAVVVASKSGTKYHYPWCGGASQIKEKNKIFFNNSFEAKNAGLEKARNCKGLK